MTLGIPDPIHISVCECQGEAFRYAAKKGYDLERFRYLFLNSDFCYNFMDIQYSSVQRLSPAGFLDEMIIEYGYLPTTNAEQDPDLGYFVGYVSRYMFYRYGLSGKKILDIFSFSDMKNAYINSYGIDSYEDIAREMLEKAL